MDSEVKNALTTLVRVAWLLLVVVVLGMWGCPQYSIYSARCEGESELAKANYSKQVAVQEATAKKDAATDLAIADTIRAHGIAKSNIIVGKSLSESYLHWFWIDNIEKNPNAVIYIPTEANMPIMEANRLKEK